MDENIYEIIGIGCYGYVKKYRIGSISEIAFNENLSCDTSIKDIVEALDRRTDGIKHYYKIIRELCIKDTDVEEEEDEPKSKLYKFTAYAADVNNEFSEVKEYIEYLKSIDRYVGIGCVDGLETAEVQWDDDIDINSIYATKENWNKYFRKEN